VCSGSDAESLQDLSLAVELTRVSEVFDRLGCERTREQKKEGDEHGIDSA
jgi:hypothetical protein